MKPEGYVWSIYTPFLEQFRRRVIAILEDKQHPEAAVKRPVYQSQDGVALIRIRGYMDKVAYWSDETSTISTINALKAATLDRDIGAIMLILDTPGGSVDGIAELEDALWAARQVKPLVAQVSGMAASAGYWAASQVTRIYAHRLDQIGSIGVRMAVWDDSKYYEDIGMKLVVVDTGEYKSAGLPGAPVTENQIKDFQRIVDTYYDNFLKAISRGRGMSMSQIKPLADGRVFIGQEAVDNGLIDGIQTFEQTFAQLRQLVVETNGTPRRDRAAAMLRLAKAI